MASSIYTVQTSILPAGVTLDIDQAELERLTELGVLDNILEVTVPVDRVLITDGEAPQAPATGQVWFNRAIA